MTKVHAIKLLQASADPDDISELRLLVDHQHIKYVTVDPYIFDYMDLIFEPTLIEILRPLLPTGDWNNARIFQATSSGKSTSGNAEVAEVQVETSIQVQPGILRIWHSLSIDYLELEVGSRLRSNVREATCSKIPGQFVVKFARFHYEIAQLEHETTAYKWINGHNIGPEFLGHVTEHGRVIGFAMSKIEEARHATPADLDICRQALRRLHTLGIKHGDTNKHNFLIHPQGVTMIDLDFAEQNATEAELNEELFGLEQQLADTSGKGGIVELIDSTNC
ncbi:alpha-galactosidase A precursor [Boeremia exigua]|uniref:alpha-galactosidase A precursor n=1 Tax=Boeremia exigua TaxID=749465 RepID=UPI001E8DD8C1|nr:alpha-galactosidase A precursor [Boeremia exigua]KAH6613889.1 alpha-galactosidase A precursor [Boeremia exigua]